MTKKDEPAKHEKWGAAYLNGKVAVEFVAPVGFQAMTDRSAAGFRFRLGSAPYWKGNAVALIDRWGSKKIGQAAALSRGSLTAIIGEAVPPAEVLFVDKPRGVVDIVNDYTLKQTGYNFVDNSFDIGRVRTYGLIKYGLGIGRKIAAKFRFFDPIKDGISMVSDGEATL